MTVNQWCKSVVELGPYWKKVDGEYSRALNFLAGCNNQLKWAIEDGREKDIPRIMAAATFLWSLVE